jgi:hypothetical protein
MTTRVRQRGVTLLEVALGVMSVGIILTLVFVARPSDRGSGLDIEGELQLDRIVVALQEFATRNHRLPCPDTNLDGLEDASCTAAVKTGGVPFATLGIALSAPVGQGSDLRYAYSVYRGGGDLASDLTVVAERSLPVPHASAHASYQNLDDFRQALINARNATRTTVNAAEVHVTGNGAQSGPADCNTHRIANMAFVVAYAGQTNADASGGLFDGPHLVGRVDGSPWSAHQTWTCFAGPGLKTPSYDDQVRAIGFYELLGMLSQ